MTQLLAYVQRVAPGVLLGLVLLALLARARPGARLCVHLALFVLLRDAMTPLGLWRLEARPVFWLRLPGEPALALSLAGATFAIALALLRFERELAQHVVWLRRPSWIALAAGAGAAIVIAAPVLWLAHGTPAASRGGAPSADQLAAVAVFSLVGNAYEEVLFRGFLQGYLREQLGELRALLVAGLAFAFGHVFLSATVTDLGASVLAFTAYEGLICAVLNQRVGLAGSIVAHGAGIWLVASGLG